MKEQPQIIKPFPRKLAIYFSLIYATPIVAAWLILNFLHVFKTKDALRALVGPIPLIAIAAAVAYLIFIYNPILFGCILIYIFD